MTRAESLRTKVMAQAELAADKQWIKNREDLIQRHQPVETKADKYRSQIVALRARTADLEMELRLKQRMEAESARTIKAFTGHFHATTTCEAT